MRLLLVVPRYGADAVGSAAHTSRDLATRLVRRGHQVEVATSCSRSSLDWADELEPGTTIEAGVEVHRFRVWAPRDPRFFGPMHERVFGAPVPVAHVVQREWMRMHGPDLPELPAWLSSRATDVDVAILLPYASATSFDGLRALTGLTPTLLHPLAHEESTLGLGMFDQMFRAADAFGFVTEEEQHLVDRRFGVERPSIVIGTGIDIDERHDVEHEVGDFRERFGLDDAPYLLAVGQIEFDPGAAELAEMFAARAARRGNGVALVALENTLGGPAHATDLVVTGPVDEPTRSAAMAGCLALVQPSFRAGGSTVLLEAWAHRRPALVQGRCDELVGQARRSGGAIPYDGFAEFEAAVDTLLASPELVTSLGQAGRRYVESQHRWDDVLTRYEWFLEDVSARWRPPSAARRFSSV